MQFKDRRVQSKALLDDCVKDRDTAQKVVKVRLRGTDGDFLANTLLDFRMTCKLVEDPLDVRVHIRQSLRQDGELTAIAELTVS